jgi:hypothetical protein
MKDIFEEIYRQQIWFDPESKSGPGSNLAQTSTVRKIQQRYASPTRQFVCADVTQSPLPQVDLIFSRDCLVHFSNADIKKSNGKFLLTTTFTTWHNFDIRKGSWRPLNVQAYPFLFPTPLRLMEENCTEISGAYRDKSLGLWEIDSLPDLSSL